MHRHFGAISKDVAAGRKLHHEHGPNSMSDDFQEQIDFLGIEASPSFVREPEGNGVAEGRGVYNRDRTLEILGGNKGGRSRFAQS